MATNQTFIQNSKLQRYSGDQPGHIPPEGWERVTQEQLNPKFFYLPFVWLEAKQQPVSIVFDASLLQPGKEGS